MSVGSQQKHKNLLRLYPKDSEKQSSIRFYMRTGESNYYNIPSKSHLAGSIIRIRQESRNPQTGSSHRYQGYIFNLRGFRCICFRQHSTQSILIDLPRRNRRPCAFTSKGTLPGVNGKLSDGQDFFTTSNPSSGSFSPNTSA